MPVLTPGQPFASASPALLVENRLAPGSYRFELVVVDDSDNASVPAQLLVTVLNPPPPPPPPNQPPPPPPPGGGRFGIDKTVVLDPNLLNRLRTRTNG